MTYVEGGVAAIDAVATQHFDVVLMAVHMPKMEGLEATCRIRALEGKHRRVPIIAMMAKVFTDQIAECRKAGMGSHLAKPFDLDTLLAAVKDAARIDDNLPPGKPSPAAEQNNARGCDAKRPAVDVESRRQRRRLIQRAADTILWHLGRSDSHRPGVQDAVVHSPDNGILD